MRLIQISLLLLLPLQLVLAAPPLLARFPNATYGLTTGNASFPNTTYSLPTANASTTFPISDSGKASIYGTASPTFNQTHQPMFPSTGNWTSLPCNVLDKSIWKGSDAWASAGASDAWNQLVAYWNNPDRVSNFGNDTFAFYSWSAFQERPASDCDNLDDGTCQTDVKCVDDQNLAAPAGTLILQSFVYIHNMFRDQDSALTEAYNAMNLQMVDLAATFAPTTDSGNASQILAIISSVLGFVSAGAFSTNVTEEQIETIKNVVTAGISTASSALAIIPPPTSDEDTGALLGSILNKYYNNLRQAQLAYLPALLNMTDLDSQQRLTSLMQTGFMLNLADAKANRSTTILENTAQMLWGKLITAAWGISATPQIPFILRLDKADHHCGDSFAETSSLYTLMTADTANSTLWCDAEGNSFYLLRANFDVRCKTRACPTSPGYAFEKLSGGDKITLNGQSDNFGGITIGDMITSSWAGFVQNGKQNGYGLSTDSSLPILEVLGISGGDNLPDQIGASTPGFFNFTICLDPEEAIKNILAGNTAICGTNPQVAGSSTDINGPGQFTPGLCKVHVTQYQRHEGNLNLLGSYQLEVHIKDNAGLQVGLATKQSAAEPLVIVDSVLPYNLIVAAQGPDDSSTVNFWYSDQWWTSNDQAHHCNFGAYDSGSRQGDCDFNCALPSDDPPASATITQPVPSGAIAAVAGTQIFSNTFITTTPTPVVVTTSSAPTPTYVTGNCGMHIEQYQRNEGEENPTDTFELEITIFDGHQNPIGDSGKVPAPKGQPVSVSGLVSPLTVTTSGGDNDPLTFSFNGRQWTSNDCSVGDYDSGNRNMDCGFSC